MDYLNLGKTGLKVSRICLGTLTFGTPEWRDWVLDEEKSRPIILRALEMGINFIDTADMYSLGVSEEVVGRALKDYARREEVVLASKVFFPMGDGVNQRGLSRSHILNAVDSSLKRLGTDYLDLYQIHRWDPDTPIEETLETLHSLIRSGKVRYIGASSMYAWQFAKALYTADLHGWTRFVTMQNHYNLVYREEEREMMPLCRAEGVAVIPWSPLARGFLTGTRRRGAEVETARSRNDSFADHLYFKEADYQVQDRLMELADRRGLPPAQLALAWLLHKPGVTAPIIGASKISHLEDAVGALEVSLSEDEMNNLEEPYQPHPVLGLGL
jgi:1-deoxyxylulose-5-phosphate synthase